jgi:CheY-like chemotaxis protein
LFVSWFGENSKGLHAPFKKIIQEPARPREVGSQVCHFSTQYCRRKMSKADRDRNPVVLVVEDETLVRVTALAIIEESGFEAIAAGNADEAIRALETRGDIRAVFTDVQMPGPMDGLKLAQVIRDRWPPVALLVTSGKTRVTASDLPSGARFLPKPYFPLQIEMTLREMLEKPQSR